MDAAAQYYFGKGSDLNVSESAVFAGIFGPLTVFPAVTAGGPCARDLVLDNLVQAEKLMTKGQIRGTRRDRAPRSPAARAPRQLVPRPRLAS